MKTQDIQDILDRARLLNSLVEIPTYCGHKCYMILQSDIDNLLLIPDEVTELNFENTYKLITPFSNAFKKFKSNIKVVGGNNLIDASYMFYDCEISSLDLSSFNTSNVIFMNAMFENCEIQSIDFSYIDTRNVTDMRFMFTGCRIQSLDLSKFDTSKVTNMTWMFTNCKAKFIDLSSFDTSKVKEIESIFENCQSEIKATDPRILKAYQESR